VDSGLAPNYLGLSSAVLVDLRAREADVGRFHQMLGDPTVPSHPESWLIYGTGQTTEVAIAFGAGGAEPVTDHLGDTTVSALSATSLRLPEERMIRAEGVIHAAAWQNGLVQEQVETILVRYG
jgi:hypothetical protein